MSLRDTMRLYGIKSPLGRTRQEASVAEHYRIIEAVEQRTETGLEALMTKHIMDWDRFSCRLSKGKGSALDPPKAGGLWKP